MAVAYLFICGMRKKLLVLVMLAVFTAAYAGLHNYSNLILSYFLPGVNNPEEVADIVAPADENSGIAYDIHGFRKGDAFVLFLPTRVNSACVVYYAVDADGNRLERYETNFLEGTGLVADSIEIYAMQSALPSMEISLKKGSLREVDESVDHKAEAYGSLRISCRAEVAEKKGWQQIYESVNGDGSSSSVRLKGRGNNSWEQYKKGYGITLDCNQELLGLGSSRKWVLLANANDYSLLRNEFFYDFAKRCGVGFEPGIEPVDLFVNGEYRGTYDLTSRVEIGKDRIDITKNHDFLFRLGKPDVKAVPMTIESFSHEEARVAELIDNTDQGKADYAYSRLQQIISEVEAGDVNSQLSDIELESWALYYWVQEYGKNTDATSRSVYFVWNEDKQLMSMTPVWDMDMTIGAVEPLEREGQYLYPEGWAVRLEDWYVPLFKNKRFCEMAASIYYERDLDTIIRQCIADLPERIENKRLSAEMNYTRWDVLDIPQNNDIVKWMGESTYDSQNEWNITWLTNRADWIRDEMEASNEQIK